MKRNWYDSVRRYTERLVKIRSVSPGPGEIELAQEVVHILHEDGLTYTASGLDPLQDDPYNRQNAYAYLRGRSPKTIILLGHFDIVETRDYGELEPWALDPDGLAARLDQLLPEEERRSDTSDWMFGRGAGDMKSGVAVNLALIRHFAQETGPFPLSLVMLATPDEENESAGVLQAVRFLLRLREQHNLEYLGLLNTDYVTELYPGDPHRYIYAGSIGKLLPSFLCIGRAAHVGIPFQGLDTNLLAAELIREISMNYEWCDSVLGQLAAPPVTLHATDLKTHYDVQLPLASYFYVNVLTLTTTPEELLERLRWRTETVLARLLRRLDETERNWREASGEQGWRERFQPRSGQVFTYAELYAATVAQLGKDRVDAELAREWQQWPFSVDSRERSLRLAHRLWSLSDRQGPAVIIYYAPPYYPAVPPVPGSTLHQAVEAVVAAHPEARLELRPYFPYLSDMSYLNLDPAIDLLVLKANMPLWQPEDQPALPGAYKLPLAEIRQLGLPVIDWGPFGRGAHQRDEAVLMPYTFETLPQLLYETLQHIARDEAR